MILRARPSTVRCVFCHDDHPSSSCGVCGALYHADCRRELGRCATIGCRRVIRFPDRGAVGSLVHLVVAIAVVATLIGFAVVSMRSQLEVTFTNGVGRIDRNVCGGRIQ